MFKIHSRQFQKVKNKIFNEKKKMENSKKFDNLQKNKEICLIFR
jgi:hypothetical protein